MKLTYKLLKRLLNLYQENSNKLSVEKPVRPAEK
jgi:hypothetical protein